MGDSSGYVLSRVFDCSREAGTSLSTKQTIYSLFRKGAALNSTLEQIDDVWKLFLEAKEALDRRIVTGKDYNRLHHPTRKLFVYLVGIEKAIFKFQNASLLKNIQWRMGISSKTLSALASSCDTLDEYNDLLTAQLDKIFGECGRTIAHPVLRHAWALGYDDNKSDDSQLISAFRRNLDKLLQKELLHQTYDDYRPFWKKCINEFTETSIDSGHHNRKADKEIMIHWMNESCKGIGRNEVYSARKLLSRTPTKRLQETFCTQPIMVIKRPVRCLGDSHEVCSFASPERSNQFLGIDISGELSINSEELNYFYINIIQEDSTFRQLIPFPFRQKGYGWSRGSDGQHCTTFGLTAGAAALLGGDSGSTISISISCQTSTDSIEVRHLKVEAIYLAIR